MNKSKLIAENKRLRAIIEDALQPGVFGELPTIEQTQLNGTMLLPFCKQMGFGAVMAQVQWLWKTNTQHPGSEYTVAACAAVREKWIKDAREALKRGQ